MATLALVGLPTRRVLMPRVYIHPYAGVLSAYRMGLANITAMRELAVEARLDEALLPRLASTLDALADAASAEVVAQSVAGEVNRVVATAELEPLTREYADNIGRNAPLTLVAIKRSLIEYGNDDDQRDLAICDKMVKACFAS